jgi:hypothetical protein
MSHNCITCHTLRTGSFISGSGLIITNHHVAYDAVRQVSAAALLLLAVVVVIIIIVITITITVTITITIIIIITINITIIITITQASSVTHDYLKNGFVAGDRQQEIPCKDYEVHLA